MPKRTQHAAHSRPLAGTPRKSGLAAGILTVGILAAGILSFFIQCAPAPAWAWEVVKVMPTVSVRETYDSNINLMGKGDLEHTVTPGVRVDLKQERVRGFVEAKAAAVKYTRLNSFDRIDQNYQAGLEVNATEKITANIKGGVVADHAFASALSDTGEQAPRRASRQVYSVQPSVTVQVGETNSLTLFHAFAKTVYDTKDYTDSVSNTLGGLWGHRLSERTQLLLQLSGALVTAPSTTQNSVSALGGFEYALAETLKARVLGGVGSLHSKADGAEARTASNYAADTSLEWQLERLNTKFGYSRDMTLGITGADLVRDRLSLNLGLSATERLQLLLGGNLVLSESTSSAQALQKSRWYEISPGAKYMVGENSSLTLGYAYGASADRIKDEVKTRNRVYLDFNIAFP